MTNRDRLRQIPTNNDKSCCGLSVCHSIASTLLDWIWIARRANAMMCYFFCEQSLIVILMHNFIAVLSFCRPLSLPFLTLLSAIQFNPIQYKNTTQDAGVKGLVKPEELPNLLNRMMLSAYAIVLDWIVLVHFIFKAFVRFFSKQGHLANIVSFPFFPFAFLIQLPQSNPKSNTIQ